MVLLADPALKEKRGGGDHNLVRARPSPWMQAPVREPVPLSQFVVAIGPPPTAVAPILPPVGAALVAPAPAINHGEFRGERRRRT